MKKKFMRGIAAFLAAVMMLPTAAFAETTENPTDTPEGSNQEISQLSDDEGGEHFLCGQCDAKDPGRSG